MNSELGHEQVIELTPVYVAGGLEGAELAAFEAHLARCTACASAVERARAADRRMESLFAGIRPPADFEDRVILDMRQRTRMRISPAIRRAAIGVAAALLLGSVGLAGNYVAEHGLTFRNMERPEVAAVSAPAAIRGEADERGVPTRKYNALKMEKDQLIEQLADSDGGRSEGEAAELWGKKGAAGGLSVRAGDSEAALRRHSASESVDGTKRLEDLAAVRGKSAKSSGGAADAEDSRRSRESAGGYFYDNFTTVNGATPGAPAAHFQLAKEFKSRTESGGEKSADTPVVAGNFVQKEAAGKDVVALGTVKFGESGDGKGEGRPQPQGAANQTGLAPGRPNAPESTTSRPNPFARKIIRNGEMEFQVDSFDSAFVAITKIVGEQGGYVQSSSSDKLANGKVRGTVVLRVPPDQLDALILKLRALGELKSQKVSAQDVTKVYYDLESELKAARAMEERLLSIIKTGKGEIKDLIEAEKQLGVYREKIEKLEGEKRYYENMISFSTLSITLIEKDIRTAAFAAQTETVSLGMETEDVKKARDESIKSIEDAKGRVVESNLKQYDAGQFTATIVCEAPPDAAGPLIDRFRQIGRVTRLDIDRRQTAPGEAPAGREIRVEKKDTRFSISIYNLANVAPRQTSNLNLAVANVDDAYSAVLNVVRKNSGRIVTSTINRQKPEQSTATINFEVPSASAEALLSELRAGREVMALTVTENPDTNNVTAAKRGFIVQIFSIAAVAPRESQRLNLAAKDVPAAFSSLLSSLRDVGARIIASQLNESNVRDVSAVLDFEFPTDKQQRDSVEKALASAGVVFGRDVTRAADIQNTVETKLRMTVKLVSADQLEPREQSRLVVKVSDVEAATASARDAALKAGGRIISSQQNTEPSGAVSQHVVLDVPQDQADKVRSQLKDLGTVRIADTSNNPQTPDGPLSRARLDVTLTSADMIVARDQGLSASLRHALSLSVKGLLWTAQILVMGLLLLGPWLLIGWGIWRYARRKPATPSAA